MHKGRAVIMFNVVDENGKDSIDEALEGSLYTNT